MPLNKCILPVTDKPEDERTCGSPVSRGGNVHAKGSCPPPPRPGGNRHARYAKKNARKRAAEVKVTRGAPVSVGSKGAKTRDRKGAGKKKEDTSKKD